LKQVLLARQQEYPPSLLVLLALSLPLLALSLPLLALSLPLLALLMLLALLLPLPGLLLLARASGLSSNQSPELLVVQAQPMAWLHLPRFDGQDGSQSFRALVSVRPS